MKRWALARTYNIHAGYVYPNLFVDYYIRNISYDMLALKPFHIQILSAIKPGEYGKQINIQAPRSTGKTTLVNRLIPLWRICYKAFDLAMGRQPEEFILIVGRDAGKARQRISEIRQVIEQNPRIRRDFGDLVGTPLDKNRSRHPQRHRAKTARARFLTPRCAPRSRPTHTETLRRHRRPQALPQSRPPRRR